MECGLFFLNEVVTSQI